MYNEEFELVNFVCSRCGQILVQVLPASQVLCRKCNRWVKQQSRERKLHGVGIKKYSMSVVCK